MPLNATFSADFASFVRACADAEVSLKGIDSGASKVGTSLTRMADSLSGVKVIQQATLMAEAVGRVGGVSTLTQTELAKVGAVAQEAQAKLIALGQEVPPKIQAIADAAKAAQQPIQESSTLLQKFGADVIKTGVAFATGLISVQALKAGLSELVSFAKDSIEQWSKQEAAYNRLGVALSNAGLAAPSAKQQMIELGETFR